MASYSMIIRPLTSEEGGGYSVSFPDLPGCPSDGDTPAEAAANGEDAMQAWLASRAEDGLAAPMPGAARTAFEGKMRRIGAAMTDLLDLTQASSQLQAEREGYVDTVEQMNKLLLMLLRQKLDGSQVRTLIDALEQMEALQD